jgi:hypothetical protein
VKTPKRGKSDADESALKARYRAGKILSRYTHAHFTEIAQTSVCNRVHTMRQRCARWLLQTHDRVGTAEFRLDSLH